MAAQILKRGRAIVWVPPRSSGERTFASSASLLAMLPAAASARSDEAAGAAATTVFGGAHYARLSLDALPALKAVSLVFDARDVTLLRVAVPPLSGGRLRQALPNLVEDLLLQDAGACAFALGPRLDDVSLRPVAVIDRDWLEFVVCAFERRGVRVQAAWPAQLVLPLSGNSAALACLNDGIALRTATYDGIGWAAGAADETRIEAIVCAFEAAPAETVEGSAPGLTPGTSIGSAIGSAEALAPPAVPGFAEDAAPGPAGRDDRRRLVAFVEDGSWEAPVHEAAARLGLGFELRALALPMAAPIDLLDARHGSGASRWFADVDWHAWRVPAMAAAASIAVAGLGLNLHRALLEHEADALKQRIEQRYREAFPNTPVIVDAMLQMQRDVTSLRLRTGQSGADDFVPLLARFAQALGEQAIDATASLEYREARLQVRFQPGFFEASAARDLLARNAQRLGLAVHFDGERPPTASVALLN